MHFDVHPGRWEKEQSLYLLFPSGPAGAKQTT